jgi:hypothetical protein
MGQTRFEEIKRWFHLSPPQTLARRRFFDKLEPLSSHLQERSCHPSRRPLFSRSPRVLFLRLVHLPRQRYPRPHGERSASGYVIPATEVSVDEMMVRFTGRSHHTQRMPYKPIPEGYKIFSYAWAYYSRVDSFYGFDKRFPGPHPDGPNPPLELIPTSRMFFWLCMTLLWKGRRFVVFCDNYFSNVPFLRALLVYGSACCGKARPNSACYPQVLKQVEKKKKQPGVRDNGKSSC